MKKYYKESRRREISYKQNNWICDLLRWNCLLKQVIEGKIGVRIEVTGI
jgi:hypothetical protein